MIIHHQISLGIYLEFITNIPRNKEQYHSVSAFNIMLLSIQFLSCIFTLFTNILIVPTMHKLITGHLPNIYMKEQPLTIFSQQYDITYNLLVHKKILRRIIVSCERSLYRRSYASTCSSKR